ncbi:Sec62/63 complex, subunit Sec66 [Mortierella sp. GBAus27b]|nr:translocation protein S66 [Mortierella sp. GBA43]KAI8352289.1 Sec62/63 complex, subunit Sec66 [Mortierella sp. GBAus27b]
MAKSVWLAAVYIGGWILVMRIFGFFWRRRKTVIDASDTWFPENQARLQYIALLQQEDPEAPEAQLKAALMHRAVEVVRRIITMREDKPALASLVKQGIVGDETWMDLQFAEKTLEDEIRAVMEEAETFKEGWSSTILQSASELIRHEHIQEEKAKREEEERNQAREEKNAEEQKEREREQNLQELIDEEVAEKKKKAPGSAKKNKPRKK